MKFTQRIITRRVGGVSITLVAALLSLTTAYPTLGQTISIDPIRTIVPVTLDATTGSITVGTTTYNGANPGFHVLALSRQPNPKQLDAPDKIWDQTYTGAASVNNALQSILQQCPDCLLIVNAVGNYGVPLGNVAQQLAKFGSYPDLQMFNTAPPFIFVGIGGANAQSALQRGNSTRNVNGYLAQDSNGNYAFVQLDYVRYDITTDGTITIGGKAHKAADAGYKPGCDAAASDSFHLLVVDRESPNIVLADNVYCTRSNTSLLNSMANDLTGVQGEDQLVFIATNGHPIPPDVNFNTGGDLRVFLLARQMARLGGYYETMVYLTGTDTYSLVGSVAPPSYVARARDRAKEASSVYPAYENGRPRTGELHGVLSRGRGNWYSPLNADPSGTANLQFYDILAQPPTAFPQFTGDQATAYTTITTNLKNLGLCPSPNCIRSSYSNLNVDPASTYQGPISQMLDSSSGTPTPCVQPPTTAFCQVRAQLLSELIDASNVRAFYTNMSGLWLAGGSVNILSSLSAYNDVKATLPAPPTAQSPSLVGPLVSFFLGLAGNLPVVGQAFGLANTGFSLGMSLATDSNGNKTVDLTSTIGQLEQQARDHFIAQGTTLGTMFQVVLEDYGKLNTLGSHLLSNDPSWNWDLTTTTQVVNEMKTAVTQAAYQNIMAAAYAIGSYVPQSPLNCSANGRWPAWGQLPLWQQPNAYTVLDVDFKSCSAGASPVVQPFNTVGPAYIPYTYPTDPANPYVKDQRTSTIMADTVWLAISLQTSPYNSGPAGIYNPPASSLLSNLFTPLQQGGLGVYRPAFFEGWPFPRVTCDPSYGVYPPGWDGMSIGGCNWAAGQSSSPPPPPGPPTGITIRANQISKNQTQVNLLLSVFNSGTERANSIEITSITLRTLGGAGQATAVSPALPARVLNLAPGDSTDVPVTLNIPPTITKLGITEQGSINAAGPVLAQFSEGQVLYPR